MKLVGFIDVSLALIVIVFQVALACGAPWGELTMGARFVGSLPAAHAGSVSLSGGIVGVHGGCGLAESIRFFCEAAIPVTGGMVCSGVGRSLAGAEPRYAEQEGT